MKAQYLIAAYVTFMCLVSPDIFH